MKEAILFLLVLTFAAAPAHGSGKKPATPEEPSTGQAKPFRYLKVDPMTVPAFYFPNGKRADFNVDLNQLIVTELNGSRYFRSQRETGAPLPHLAVGGGITSFEADVLQLNLKIGWNKNGPISVPANATGEVDLRLTAMSMDFWVYDRERGFVYLAGYTDEKLSDLKLQVKVNLGQVNGSLDLFYKEVMAKAVRRAAQDIFRKLEDNAAFNDLPWSAKISGVDKAAGLVVIDAGRLAGVRAGDVYSVYAECEGTAGCLRLVTDVKVDRASSISAEASPATATDSVIKVEAGDRVEVKPLLKTMR